MSTLKIQLYKTYEDGNGVVYKIESFDGNGNYFGRDTKNLTKENKLVKFNSNGRRYQTNCSWIGNDPSKDLQREVVGLVAPEFEIEVGKRYRKNQYLNYFVDIIGFWAAENVYVGACSVADTDGSRFKRYTKEGKCLTPYGYPESEKEFLVDVNREFLFEKHINMYEDGSCIIYDTLKLALDGAKYRLDGDKVKLLERVQVIRKHTVDPSTKYDLKTVN